MQFVSVLLDALVNLCFLLSNSYGYVCNNVILLHFSSIFTLVFAEKVSSRNNDAIGSCELKHNSIQYDTYGKCMTHAIKLGANPKILDSLRRRLSNIFG